ncbi:MAG: DUF2339 domain-containing protein [Chloroflexi bacterium]|nr:DUF2339 domain-containing protein [Chloroflexota bacterium]MCY3939035.1 DUF2339 domain-containing protein [Chloroflexota bacterium]
MPPGPETAEQSRPPERAVDLSEPDALRAAVLDLQAEVIGLSRRIKALEDVPPVRGPVAASAAASPAGPTSTVTPRAHVSRGTPGPSSVGASVPSSAQATGGSQKSLPVSSNWEWWLGGNWLARIGILALIFGVGFFLKLAFDNDWIDETGRVVLGLVAGLALLGGGEIWSRRYAAWARAVTGGGIAILYLSIFAAFSLYDLLSALETLGASLLVTLAASGLALRYESRAVAVLGILGGFVAPLLLAGSLADQWVLLVYVLLLDLGVLALAAFRNWRWFTLLGLVGSLILFGFWKEELDPSLLLAQVGITVIFLIFVGATTLFHLLWRRPAGPLDHALMVLNAAAYFGISYALLFEEFRDWMGGFTLLLAVFYGLLSYGILARRREQIHLRLFALGIAIVFLTIAVPVQLDGGPWIGVAWAAEGAVLIWLSFILRTRQLRWFGIAAFVITLGWLLPDLGFDLSGEDLLDRYEDSGQPITNFRLLTYLLIIGAAYLSAAAWWRWLDDYRTAEDWGFVKGLLTMANALTLWILSVQVVMAVDLAASSGSTAGNLKSLSLSGLWALYAAVLIVLGIVRRWRWLRLSGLVLLAIPVLKLFVYDAFSLEREYRVAAFIGLGGLLVAGGFLYQRYSRVIRGFLLD